MFKRRAFTLIEILSTITLLAIVATIAAPEYWRMQSRDKFRAEGQALFDAILYTRNAALTNKKCNNDQASIRWMVWLDTNVVPASYQVRCYYDDTNFTTEKASVVFAKTDLEIVDFNGVENPPAMDGNTGNLFPDSTQISFFTGGVNARIDYDTGSLVKADSFRLLLGHADTDTYESTICFNRISGFPTFNKSGNTCQDY